MTLRIIPLGGLGEIGMNLMVYEYGDSAIVVDCFVSTLRTLSEAKGSKGLWWQNG